MLPAPIFYNGLLNGMLHGLLTECGRHAQSNQFLILGLLKRGSVTPGVNVFQDRLFGVALRLAKGHIFSHRAVIFQGRVPRHWQHLAVCGVTPHTTGVWCCSQDNLFPLPCGKSLCPFAKVDRNSRANERMRKPRGEKWPRHPGLDVFHPATQKLGC